LPAAFDELFGRNDGSGIACPRCHCGRSMKGEGRRVGGRSATRRTPRSCRAVHPVAGRARSICLPNPTRKASVSGKQL